MADDNLPDDREQRLKSVLFREETTCRSWQDSDLLTLRIDSLNYYDRLKAAFPVEPGQSSVITSEYADTVESIMPALMRVFTGAGEDVVQFVPDNPGDEQAAREATDYIPRLLMRENDGFTALYWFIKDALMYRLAWMGVDVEEVEQVKRTPVNQVPADAWAIMQAGIMQKAEETDADVTIDVSEDQEKQTKASVQYGEGMPSAHCGICKHFTGNSCELVEGEISPDMWCKLFEQRQPNDPPPQPTTYSGSITVRRKVKKVVVDNIAPEDGLISPVARNIDQASFVGYRKRVTASELRTMGLDQETIDSLSSDELYTAEESQRQPNVIQTASGERDDRKDSERALWIVVAYVRFDWDGDGISELLRVVYAHAGGQPNVFIEGPEEWTDGTAPLVPGSPILMSHTVEGRSLFDQVKDLQQVGTAVTRGMLDNLYIVNRPRPIVSDAIDLASLIDWTPGMPIRRRQGKPPDPADIQWIQPPAVMDKALAVLQWQESVKQRRTGVTPNNQGVPDEAMNPTATGASIITSAADARIELIARTLAETSIKRLFRLLYRAVKRVAEDAKNPIQYWNGTDFSTVDPRQWPDDMSLEVNVGLGTSNKFQQLQQITAIGQGQQQLWLAQGSKPGPTLGFEELANTMREGVRVMGYKNTDRFVKPEQAVQQASQQMAQQPPPPDPEMAKVNAQAQAKAAELQQKAALDQQAQQHDAQLAAAKLQSDIQLSREKNAADLQARREAAALDLQLAREKAAQDMQLAREKAILDADLKRQQIESEAQLEALKIKLMPKPGNTEIKEQNV